MPLGLHILYSSASDRSPNDLDQESTSVDIVAVHGLNENSNEAWTHQEKGVLWLRDILPKTVQHARVLTFDYNSDASLFTGSGFLERIQSHATTLVADLEAERSLKNASKRPIIFICHGLGGVVVKSALVHSASRTSLQTSHLNSIYISTFAIMFFGTPHDNVDLGKWMPSSSLPLSAHRTRAPIMLQPLDVITNQFAPIMKKFHLFLFWEGLMTQLPKGAAYMVEPSSAAPHTYDTERCGIMDSNHSAMVKFHQSDSAYRTVISALIKYCQSAPDIIASRWEEASRSLARMRKNEASELIGVLFDIPDKTPLLTENPKSKIEAVFQHKHFYPPCPASVDFTGQGGIMESLQLAFDPEQVSLSSMQGQKTFVLYGIGGSGKTQISAKYALDNRKWYWAIFTIDASSPRSAKDSFCKIGQKGGLEATEESGKHFLSQSIHPWLLIIDNADRTDLNFGNLLVPGDRGHILVTTKNPSLRKQGNAGSKEVKGLEEGDALRLLMKVADIIPPWDVSTERAAKEITKALGYLAIAVTQAGKSIYNKICQLSEFLGFYRAILDSRRKIRLSSSSGDPVNQNTENDDVFSAFDCSFQTDAIKDTKSKRDASEILNIVSFYHFDSIPVALFERAMTFERNQLSGLPIRSFLAHVSTALISRLRPHPTLPRFLKETVDNMHPLCIREALGELYGRSMIAYGADQQTFSLHPLLHDWARDRIPAKERSLWAMISFNTLMASVQLPGGNTADFDPSFQRSLIPHLRECLEACPREFKEFHGLKIGKSRRALLFLQPTLVFSLRDMIQNAAKCGTLYAVSGDFSKSAHYLSLAKEALVILVGVNDPKTMIAMLGLASIFWGLGRLDEAIALQQQVIKSREKVLGPNHRDTLQAMDSLGRSFWLNGQYCEALELQQQTADKMRICLGDEDTDTLDALDHLGVTLGAWHRFEESRALHQDVLAIRVRTLKDKDLRIFETQGHLAMALLDLKQYDESRSLMEDVYNARKRLTGKEHPYTLLALCYLSKICIERGDLIEAEEMLTEGIAAGKRSLGADHLGVLIGCGELCRAYARQGRLEEAERLSLETVARVKEVRGSEHPDYANGMWKLGQLWELKQDLPRAKDAYQAALVATEARLTRRHPLWKNIADRIAFLSEPSQREGCQDADVEEMSSIVPDVSLVSSIDSLRARPLQTTQTW